MRTYIYLSEPKIDLLLSQASGDSYESGGAALRLELATVHERVKQGAELEAKIRAVHELDLVGAHDDDLPYIRAKNLEVTWSVFGRDNQSPITYWGRTSSTWTLGLVGSRQNVLGEETRAMTHSNAFTPIITKWILDHMGDLSTTEEEEAKRLDQIDWIHCHVLCLNDKTISDSIHLASSRLRSETMRIDFVAKAMHRSLTRPGLVVATPLYVARVD